MPWRGTFRLVRGVSCLRSGLPLALLLGLHPHTRFDFVLSVNKNAQYTPIIYTITSNTEYFLRRITKKKREKMPFLTEIWSLFIYQTNLFLFIYLFIFSKRKMVKKLAKKYIYIDYRKRLLIEYNFCCVFCCILKFFSIHFLHKKT